MPLAALDLGLHNWERNARTLGGLPADTEPDDARLDAVGAALGL